MKVQDLLDALLVLEDLLHARLLEGGVAWREQSYVAQVTDGAHDFFAEISNGLVKLVHRSVFLFLNGDKRFLVIDFVAPGGSYYGGSLITKRKEMKVSNPNERNT